MVVDNSVCLQLILSVVLISSMIPSANFLLRLMDTPPEIFSMASSYLKISLSGIIIGDHDFRCRSSFCIHVS
jgi:Na+-driven multidrug efflux pump